MASLSNDDGDGNGNENDKEATSLDEQNNNVIRPSRFLYILGRRCTTAAGNRPIFTRPLYGVGEHCAKFSFFFFYQIRSFWIQPQTRILQTFDKLNEIEWEKFETVPIHFFKWCCRFVIIQAPVFQKLDNAIHCINHYPADTAIGFPNTHPLDSDLSGG